MDESSTVHACIRGWMDGWMNINSISVLVVRTWSYSIVNSPPCNSISKLLPIEMERRDLTARTLSNDDLPAFCRPTMVTSISVALISVSACLVLSSHMNWLDER